MNTRFKKHLIRFIWFWGGTSCFKPVLLGIHEVHPKTNVGMNHKVLEY